MEDSLDDLGCFESFAAGRSSSIDTQEAICQLRGAPSSSTQTTSEDVNNQ